MKQQAQDKQDNKVSAFLARYTYVVITFSIILGIAIGYGSAKIMESKAKNTPSQRVVQLMIHNGTSVRTWNNVTLDEGESVVNLVKRVSDVEGLPLTLNGSGRDEEIGTLMGSSPDTGVWKYYINNANPLPTIGKYFPKEGDVVSVVYVNKQ